MSTATQDWTRQDQSEQFNDEEYSISGSGFVAPQSADQIAAENSFDQVPPGDRVLVVKGLVGKPAERYEKVFLDGSLTSYTSDEVCVEYHLTGCPRMTIRDYFQVPPRDPRQHRAYFEGKKQADDKAGGFQAKKFLHWIDRIGFKYPPGGQLPPEALQVRNWKRRPVKAKVEAGKPYEDKETKEKKAGYNRIKLFSYDYATPGDIVDPTAGPTAGPTHPMSPAPQAAAPAAAPDRADAALANL